jgi:abortive infection bacteriophage resistance protein
VVTHAHLGAFCFQEDIRMTVKEFKTVDEQLEILRSRGLNIDDDTAAKNFLLHNNYYRISGYSLTLRKDDVFSKSATFQNIIDIYSFDHEFRHIILKYIEIIEVHIKSIYAYEFTKLHGATGYLDSAFFTNESKHKEIINKANLQAERRLPHEPYLKHFINDLKQDIPLWSYVDLLTISDISFLYSISEPIIKNAVAGDFGFTMNKGALILGGHMHSMTIIRNLCAHGSRIYNRLFEQKPSLNKKEKSLLIRDEHGQIDNSHFYGFLLVMRRLLQTKDFKEMKQSIITLNDKYPFVRMDYYGFRDDWKQNI